MTERGKFGPYLQSKRLAMYRAAADSLVQEGNAYHCFCSSERLAGVREKQQAEKRQPKYDRHCLELSKDAVHAELQKGTPFVIRLRVPEGETHWNDLIRGPVTFSNEEKDDQVLLKSDGFPTYHLAVVVDDHAMNITTVVRGEEWISPTPKHLMLNAMLGYTPPQFAHVPLLLNADKHKLSKRQADVSVESYLDRGYLAQALVNFVSTLGFNPRGDKEIYTIQELIEEFNLRKVKKSGAVVNFDKLDWMNRQYIQSMDDKTLMEAVRPFISSIPEQSSRILSVERDRVTTLTDLAQALAEYPLAPVFSQPHILIWKKSDGKTAIRMLERSAAFLSEECTATSVADLEHAMKEWIGREGFATGDVLWPLRVALSGKEKSASPFEYIYILGKEESMARIEHAISALKGNLS